jgi:hypothetical protein
VIGSSVTIVGAALFFLSGAILFAGFDRLVYLQYRDHRDLWEADGRVPGYFWRPPEAAKSFFGFGRDRLFRHWTLHPPEWTRAHHDARNLLRVIRVALFVGVSGWLAIVWDQFVRS